MTIDLFAALDPADRPEPVTYEGPKEYVMTPATVKNALDVIEARRRLDVYTLHIRQMADQATAHHVTDDATNKAAVAMASQAKALFNAVEDQRKEIVKEPNAFIKSVNAFAKEFTAQLQGIEADLKMKISRYQLAQEKKRIEAQRKAEEEARALQEQINKEADEAGIDPVVIPAPVVTDKPAVTRTEAGSASIRKGWTWKLVDVSKVPAEYLEVNRTLLNQAVKAGIRAIPGIEIYEEASTVIRSAGIGAMNGDKF